MRPALRVRDPRVAPQLEMEAEPSVLRMLRGVLRCSSQAHSG